MEGSLFEKEQGGHTFSFEPRGAATAGRPMRRSPHLCTQTAYARPARRSRACRLREPHRGVGRLFVRKGTRWPNLVIRTAWSGEGMTPHAQEPAPSSRAAECTASAARPGAHAHHPFRVASISGEKRILHAKTSAPPQRSVRAGTVGGIRPRQVPWMIAARSCSRRLLGLGGPGLTPPCQSLLMPAK